MSTIKSKIINLLNDEVETSNALASRSANIRENANDIQIFEVLATTLRLETLCISPEDEDRQILDKPIEVFEDRITLSKNIAMLSALMFNNVSNYNSKRSELLLELEK